ncbi:hypothetical protein COPR103792_04825 [Corynebacterium propinquum]|uniref:hypothetical protein n=1 Tax=Corynebacterium propinquum TaxID=43769 RepID=UPI00036CCBC5|nr:hypothetical protein [Corynebacterium propinquum]QQU86342.1 hypothetical protein I6I70_01110 [Corynebacterium propinquum]QQU91558.1 hypothetical protein I6I69_05035 [Corynebacterium propinquum]
MSATPNFSHPENDLYDDDPSRLTQNPRSLDELAHSPDPYMRAGKDEESSRQALRFLIWAMAGSFIVGLGSLVITRLLGGTLCESGEATWLCTEASHTWWPILAWTIPFFSMVICAIIMVRKLRAGVRWRTWMGVFWVLVPNAMFWGLGAVQILAL